VVVTTLISFVVVIGLLILIHELGHFFVARWTGVGVERFSIGFGPVLFRWKRAETEYCLSAIPMGGYVKMMGDESPIEGGGGTLPYDAAKSFALKPLWVRFLIVFAGPGMNFVLAIVIFALVAIFVGRPVLPAVLGRVQDGGPAAQAGLKTGDRVIAVDGAPVAHWDELLQAVRNGNGETFQITVRREKGAHAERGGEPERKAALTPVRTSVKLPPFGDEATIWSIGADPSVIPRIGEVMPDSPAAAAGLRAGDTVLAVNGAPVYSPAELTETIQKNPGKRIELLVERAGAPLTIPVVPNLVKEKTAAGKEVEIGRIGISVSTQAVSYLRSNPIAAVGQGAVQTWEMTELTAVGLWRLITRQLPASMIGGPIQIATEAGRQAREGPTSLAFFTAVISVNLALLNLLPVPMLDGGHLLFFVIEAILGRPLSLKKREIAQQVGFFLLMLLMVFAVYNDLARTELFKFLR
jgi:regulator of sigma E protease